MSEQGLDARNLRILELDLEWTTEKLEEAVQDALNTWGRIDVLINNGGIGMKSLIEEAEYVHVCTERCIPLTESSCSAQKFKRQYQINVFGHVDVTNAVLPSMRARKTGTIVVIASRSSWRAEVPVSTTYRWNKLSRSF